MGLIASGGVQSGMLGLGCVLSGQIGSGQVGAFALVSGLVGLTPESVGSGFLAAGSVLSGNVASGQLATQHFGSGVPSPNTLLLTPHMSGFAGVISTEMISGVKAVQITASGYRIAMASVSGRMPAHGVVVQNVLSGRPVDLLVIGHVQQPSAVSGNFSGYTGQPSYVGRSGQIVSLSGSFNSGGHLSGDLGQQVGVIVNSGGVLVNMIPTAFSGGALGTYQPGVGPPA